MHRGIRFLGLMLGVWVEMGHARCFFFRFEVLRRGLAPMDAGLAFMHRGIRFLGLMLGVWVEMGHARCFLGLRYA